ncbi:MAG TPA: folate family ECF transporter S component [Enterococcus columbae]|nr:folate family ECF transporter S component [Enterococcus columbae]
MEKLSTRKMAILALLVAVEVVLTHQFAIETQFIRIGFSFIPVFVMAVLFGPFWTGIGGVLADLIGMALFAKSAFFIGFTFNAFLGGVIYGLFFYKKELTWFRCLGAVLCNTVIINLILTPLWLSMMYNIPLDSWAIWSVRLVKSAIMLPIEVIILLILGKALPIDYFKRQLS